MILCLCLLVTVVVNNNGCVLLSLFTECFKSLSKGTLPSASTQAWAVRRGPGEHTARREEEEGVEEVWIRRSGGGAVIERNV